MRIESAPAEKVERNTPLLVGVAVSVAVFVVVVISSSDLISGHVNVVGDAAANQLLVDKALRGRLLVGYYSRFGFSHPGPAFLYVQAFGELFFTRWLGITQSASGGSALGVAMLNSALLGWTAALVTKVSRSVFSALAVVLITLLITIWVPGFLALAWAPALLIVPLVLMLVAGIYLAAGHYSALLPFVVSAALLIHAHISSLTFVGAAVLIVAGVSLISIRRGESAVRPSRRQLIPALAALGLFAMPIALHTVLDWPGELGAYAWTARSRASSRPQAIGEVFDFIGASLAPRPVVSVGALFALALLIAVMSRQEDRRLVRVGLLLLGVEGLLFCAYAWRTVDDPSLSYLGWFGAAITVVLLWLGIAEGLDLTRVHGDKRVYMAAGGGTLLVLSAALILSGNLGTHSADTPVVGKMVTALGAKPTRLEFEHDDWPIAVGVLAESLRAHGRVCFADPSWANMVTESHVCEPEGSGRTVVLGRVESVNQGEVLFDQDGYVLVMAPSGT